MNNLRRLMMGEEEVKMNFIYRSKLIFWEAFEIDLKIGDFWTEN